MIQWNVYIEDFNNKRIKIHNILNHGGFLKDIQNAIKKFKNDKEAFEKEVKSSLMYYYWSKCEWEIILSSWPERKDFKEEKIDVYDQVMLNGDIFINYLWDNQKEILKIKW